MSALRGGDARGNALTVRAVLAGEKGPKRDVVLLNAAFALMAAGAANSVADGIARAAGAIDSGAALGKLEQLVALTNS
jgi:anthranilate phosphoribosyltransferase